MGHDPGWQVQRRCRAAALPAPERPKLLRRIGKRPHCQNRRLQRWKCAARSEMNPPPSTPLAAIDTRWLDQRERVTAPSPISSSDQWETCGLALTPIFIDFPGESRPKTSVGLSEPSGIARSRSNRTTLRAVHARFVDSCILCMDSMW